MRLLMRSGVPAALLLAGLALGLVVVHLAARSDEGGESVELMAGARQHARQQALYHYKGKAESPIQEGEQPPFDETVEPPPPACDVQKMKDCLGSMEQLRRDEPHFPHVNDQNFHTAHLFCTKLHTPFECACQACDPKLLKWWDNNYWTNDGPAKRVLTRMKYEARCDQLRTAGAHALPPGHGCHTLYHEFCEADMDRHFCPRILGEKLSSNGVARTLENDDVRWINTRRTCRSPTGWAAETQCKSDLTKTLDPSSNFCGPHHEYLKCVCDACEEDVEKAVDGMPRYARCSAIQQTLAASPSPECARWYTDECEAPLDDEYCERVVGSIAWGRTQPKPEKPATTWETDGMHWTKYCKSVVLPLANNPVQLEESLGAGWLPFCRKKLGIPEPEGPTGPWGTGLNGHARLVVSGMPAPRSFDNFEPDTHTQVGLTYFNVPPAPGGVASDEGGR